MWFVHVLLLLHLLLPPMSAASSPSPAAGSSGPGPPDLSPGSAWGPGSGSPGEETLDHNGVLVLWFQISERGLTLLAFSRYFLYLSSICFMSSSFFFRASSSSSTRWAVEDKVLDEKNRWVSVRRGATLTAGVVFRLDVVDEGVLLQQLVVQLS